VPTSSPDLPFVGARVRVRVRQPLQVPKWDGTLGEEGGEAAAEGGDGEEELQSKGDEEDPMKDFAVPLNARTMHEKVGLCLGVDVLLCYERVRG
jgi:hypothetical protein